MRAVVLLLLIILLTACWQQGGQGTLTVPNKPQVMHINEDDSITSSAPGILRAYQINDAERYRVRVLSDVFNGQLELEPDGGYRYRPHDNFYGTDSFLFQLLDQEEVVHTGTVVFEIANIPDPPLAEPDTYELFEDRVLRVPAPGVLENDKDPDGDELSLELRDDVSHGQLNLKYDGSFQYQPESNWSGDDCFTYVVNAGTRQSQPVMVTINVRAVNDRPRLVLGTMQLEEGDEVPITSDLIQASDVDADDDQLIFQVKQLRHGAFRLKGDERNLRKFSQSHIRKGNVTFVHNKTNHAPSFVIEVSDGKLRVEQRMKIEFKPVNDPPVWRKVGFRIIEGQRIPITLSNIAGVDEETQTEELRFTVQSITALSLSDDKGRPIEAFTMDDIRHGRVFVEHDGSEVFPQLVLVLSDGEHAVERKLKVLFKRVNDEPRWTRAELSLAQGQQVLLDPQRVVIIDEDHRPEQLTVKVLKAEHLRFAHKKVPQTSLHQWSAQALQEGQIIAVHDGSAAAPSCLLEVSDGDAQSQQELAIAFQRVYQPPEIAAADQVSLSGELPQALNIGEALQLELSDPDQLQWLQVTVDQPSVQLLADAHPQITADAEAGSLRLEGAASAATYQELLQSLYLQPQDLPAGVHQLQLSISAANAHHQSDVVQILLQLQLTAAPEPEPAAQVTEEPAHGESAAGDSPAE